MTRRSRPPSSSQKLSTPALDRLPGIRRDGLEIFVASNRPGTLGGLDLWVSTRATTCDAWGSPVNLGPVVNSTVVDGRGTLSPDGTTLCFRSGRAGTLGLADLYVSTRSRLRRDGYDHNRDLRSSRRDQW